MIGLRNQLERELVNFSASGNTPALSPGDVKQKVGPVFEYFETQNCGEKLTACISENCYDRQPACFNRKIIGQIRLLLDLIRPYFDGNSGNGKSEYIPANQGNQKSKAPERLEEPTREKPKTSSKNPRILVVDDDRHQRKLLNYKLVKEGFQVESAENGIDALKKLNEQPADVIVCDLMMPGMNGFLFLQKLRKIPSLQDIPLIFLTAVNDEQSTVKGLELGADDYITKPFSPSELNTRIKKLLQKRGLK